MTLECFLLRKAVSNRMAPCLPPSPSGVKYALTVTAEMDTGTWSDHNCVSFGYDQAAKTVCKAESSMPGWTTRLSSQSAPDSSYKVPILQPGLRRMSETPLKGEL